MLEVRISGKNMKKYMGHTKNIIFKTVEPAEEYHRWTCWPLHPAALSPQPFTS